MTTNLFLRPTGGPLDIAAITAFVSSRDDVLLDPIGSRIYMIAGARDAKAVYRRARLEEPDRLPYMAWMTIEPDHVRIAQEFGDAPQLRSARTILSWILQHQAFRIEDEYGTDWTERVAREGIGVLYPATLT